MKTSVFFPLFLFAILLTAKQASSQNKTDVKPNDRLLSAVSWYQNSGEMEALYYQGFNIAHERVAKALLTHKSGKPLAVVVDIDETMLDNSPYETSLIQQGEDKNGWKKWTEKAAAKPLPGALEFASYAQSKKVDVFYITNRDNTERKSTLANLVSAGFPYATEDHLLTRGDTAFSMGNTSSKEGRRTKVSQTHEIVVLLGDNLNDFSNVFENRHENNGKAAVQQNMEAFGKKFIILPNPMYGAWEKPVYDYKEGISEEKKAELMREKLK
ncbi:MAG: 5'-nucleotidase, lipoprotein e(P4) family [Bacteroidetes bacterium]|nr:5'-nucleotidase, lipoprotein e(P4) family [Bacteroidota bacterium]